MIEIEKIRYSNFQSTGKAPIEFQFEGHEKTLIIGLNGHGKSTLLNALCFGLFGVPYTDVNKPTLVNSVNKKALLVEVWFRVGSNEYLIRRGIKPGIFEIFENDKLLPQDAKSLDYQKQIEENILRLNFNAFKQIVIVGKSGYTPFMRLKAGERREVIENILDLRVFSTMNVLLKEKTDELKTQLNENDVAINDVEREIRHSKDKLIFIKEAIDRVQAQQSVKRKEIEEESALLTKKVDLVNQSILKLTTDLVDVNTVRSKQSIIQKKSFSLESEVSGLQKTNQFFNHHENCPTCRQKIDAKFKKESLETNESLIAEKNKEKADLDSKLEKVQLIIDKIAERQNKINELKNALQMLEYKLSNLTVEEVQETVEDHGKLQELETAIGEFATQKSLYEAEKNELFKRKEMYALSGVLLKDNGIKSKIISTYIPMINKYLNQYLDIMNFYIQFEIDENFKEVIKSRYRDEFSYENFSEGEKARIDLALLFTWRQIAKIKNRINVNLLILDEVFDNSLDAGGLEDLNRMLKALEGTNVVVISHKTETIETFSRVMKFEKKNNFSSVTKVS